MANLPLRNLGQVGVITDVNPYDLPSNAFTKGNNVIFDDGKVQRAPVFKQLYTAIRSAIPISSLTGTMDSYTTAYDSAEGAAVTATRFVGSYADPVAGETLFICDNDGQVRSYPNGNLTFMTPGSGLITNESPWTHTQVAGVSFLARAGMRPYARSLKSSSIYYLLAGEWSPTDTCAVIRGYLDYAVCLNVTKGSIEYPTMVKWSNPIEYGSEDLQWDPTNPNYIAGENILGELTSPILDGLVLNTQFIIYTRDQVWEMEYTGSTLVFNFRKLFPTGGILNTNCVVEVEGKHYVFGEDDIYVHDGMSKQSIADGRIRRQLYNTIDRDRKVSCFVQHDPVTNLLFFCYVSKEDEIGFPRTQFANRAAVYNLKTNTWSFMDLPNVVGGASANLVISSLQYFQMSSGYDLYNTSFSSFQGVSPRISVMLGSVDNSNGLSESRVYAIDLPSAGAVNLTAHPETLSRALVEREGIDMDEEGGLSLRSYKTLLSVFPQAKIKDTGGTLTWQFGSSDAPNAATVWRATATFDPVVDYKIDTRVSGRYLAYQVYTDSINNFEFSGFDSEIVSTSRR